MQKLIYARGPATLASIRMQVGMIWSQLAHDAEFKQVTRDHPQLHDLDLKSPVPFVLVTNSAGLTSELGEIAVQVIKGVVLTVSTDALLALWNKVILKKVRDRMGHDVLRDKNDSDTGVDP